jgi:hypothetical protein
MIRVVLPQGLQLLAHTDAEVQLDVPAPVSLARILDRLEQCYPMLAGTVRDHVTQQRRPMVRFFANGEDWSHQSPDQQLPSNIVEGAEPLLIVGAIAGG